ncbi:PleD family two-component system response regulator [Rickettsiales endosymbiont of Paramecium tredecaurelia]|uniref:PleD family two-component system response regulator n=1 Tax=Candidatus Sarmatiella mevalonica TaxID=2770581 RepID=UPI0019222AE7|nr:PleD family two-component system response regulator [Candidatus Sarmatiella mevalonica]MBL3284901.1 PleD family two-component system response regulator [Candidatus Sarmatiella mevalonica]
MSSILIVDDIETNIKLLEIKLADQYYTIHTALSGATAIQILDQNKIDVVLLDVMMPEMNGFEVCYKIRSNPKTATIPIIMITALSDIKSKVKGLEAGADDFLTKPINDLALFTRIKSLIRIKVLMDELNIRNDVMTDLELDYAHFNLAPFDGKIVVIDDDCAEARRISKILTCITSNIDTIQSIEDPNQCINGDIFIINAQLDDCDPLKLITHIKDKINNKAIFILSSHDPDSSVLIKGLEIGIHDYFIRPVDESELLARLRTQLKREFYQESLKKILSDNVHFSIKDSLTNLYNRRYYDLHLTKTIQFCVQHNKELHLLMMDIDYFKKVNDVYGHQVGDLVLKSCANAMVQNLRADHLVARYGGEEFCVVLQDVSEAKALEIASRINKAIRDLEIIIDQTYDSHHVQNTDLAHNSNNKLTLISLQQNEAKHSVQRKIKITISIGIACYIKGLSREEFIEVADHALYRAKHEGRDRAVLYKY